MVSWFQVSRILRRESLVCFWVFQWHKSAAVLNSNWLGSFTMQSVESVIVNLVIPLRKENGIAKKTKNKNKTKKKKHAPKLVHSFLVDLTSPYPVESNCLYARIFCCSICQCSLEGANCSSLCYCWKQGLYLVFLGKAFKIFPIYQYTLGAQF